MAFGPCLCGDPCCPSCGDPYQCHVDEAIERLSDAVYDIKPSVEEIEMLIGIFPIIIKEARKVTDSVMNEYKAEQSFARSINEDN